MSTRSGKRIHNAFPDDITNTDVDLVVRSERKTRSKRLKENVDEVNFTLYKTQKRSNYVSYPTEDEQLGDTGINNDNDDKNTRVLRKTTLREHNINTPTADIDLFIDNKKPVRTTRRTRKLTENAAEDTREAEVCTNEDVSTVEKPKPKKNKKRKSNAEKNTESVLKKKSKNKKKGKRSGSMVVEEIEPEGILIKNLNRSNISVDSFHSAAGSPEVGNEQTHIPYASEKLLEHDSEVVNRTFDSSDKTLINTDEKLNKTSTHDYSLSESSDSIIFKNMNIFSEGPKRTSSMKDVAMDTNEQINNTFTKIAKKRKSSIKDSTLDKDNCITSVGVSDTTFEKEVNNCTFDSLNRKSKRKSVTKNATFVENNKIIDQIMNTTFEKDNNSVFDSRNKGESSKSPGDEGVMVTLDTTYEKDISNSTFETVNNKSNKRKSIKDLTFEKETVTSSPYFINNESNGCKSIDHTTFEKDEEETNSSSALQNNTFNGRKSSIKDTTYEKGNTSKDNSVSNATFETKNNRKSLLKASNNPEINTTFDKYKKLDVTFDKSNSKSSLVSSDNTDMTLDKSDMSQISITSDDSKENIVNTTPVLIESSMEEDSPKPNEIPITPLKREGTFTKDGPDVIIMSPKEKIISLNDTSKKTPIKRMSLPSPGCTPFHVTKSNQKEKSLLNVTRSLEKGRRSSLAEVIPRVTKVMFCSPVDDPVAVTQQKKKIIKSNLKGSNKSFVFDDSLASNAVPRKRSRTACEATEARAKRSRLGESLQHSVERLSRPRTYSAAAKLTEPPTPTKKAGTPSKPQPETRALRTRLPDFAALHRRRFDKMESLDECQERKARRARQLLTPTGALAMLERISPKGSAAEPLKTVTETKKPDTPLKSLPTLDSLKPGYTRFGFKLNLDVNPFSIPSKNAEVKPKDNKPNGALTRQGTLPSLVGATSLRREAAKQTVLREKSFTERRNTKRSENRTIIKGVRTNRRFELQMKLRNVE